MAKKQSRTAVRSTAPFAKPAKKQAASGSNAGSAGIHEGRTGAAGLSQPKTDKATKGEPAKGKKKGAKREAARLPEQEHARILKSRVVWKGPLFRVLRDTIVEPTGLHTERDVIRHNGSVVILAADRSGKRGKKDPWIVMERQYRHAANQFLWEMPAGKLEKGEDPLEGAKRELAEETGYRARKWRPLVTYYASPGFLGEAMLVYLAEDLYAGDATPEEDERIELRLVRLNDILKMIEQGAIHDGKTLNAVLLYAWLLGRKRKK